MKKYTWLAVLCIAPLSVVAQSSKVIPLSAEPHHHVIFKNNLLNLYDAKAAPGDSLLLHRHDYDAAAIAIGEQEVTVGGPGRAEVHTKVADGQVRMQRAGYTHFTRSEGKAPYFTVAIELLHQQTGSRNLCATVLPGEPLHCTNEMMEKDAKSIDQAQYESDQTQIHFVRVMPHQTVSIGNANHSQLIIALDPGIVSHVSRGKPTQALRAGDFAWFDAGGPGRTFANAGPKESRFVEFTFLDSAPAGR